MNVTLIYPGITASGFDSLGGNEGSWMHHGLAILSSALKNAGHRVSMIDMRRLKDWDHFREQIQTAECDVVGITIMSVDYLVATKATSIIRELRPEIKVFVGGPHATICPEELEPLEHIDCIVKGQGEVTFPELVNTLQDGGGLPTVVQGAPLDHLDQSPWADRDIFESEEEPFVPFLPAPFVTIIAGRGCRYVCNYCQPAEQLLFGKKVHRRTVENVIAELKYLRDKIGFRSMMIHDDCITEDVPWVTEFCKQYKEAGFTQYFVVQSRADLIVKHPEMVNAFYDAGLRMFIIGLESGSSRMLKFLKKGCTREKNIEGARICREKGIKVWANYMLGMPSETKEEVLETLSMIEEIKPYHCSPSFYTPHPGSDLFDLGKEMGIHLNVSHDLYRRNTYEPKIKGPDYDFLKDVLYKSIAIGEDNTNPVPEEYREALKEANSPIPIAKGRNRLKTTIMYRYPRLFRALRRIKNVV